MYLYCTFHGAAKNHGTKVSSAHSVLDSRSSMFVYWPSAALYAIYLTVDDIRHCLKCCFYQTGKIRPFLPLAKCSRHGNDTNALRNVFRPATRNRAYRIKPDLRCLDDIH